MSRTMHLTCNHVPGYGLSYSRCLQHSASGCPLTTPHQSDVKIKYLNCSSSRVSLVCKAGSGGHRKNPDFSRQNRLGFRGKNRQNNEERDNFEGLEESEMLSSKNGPLLSLSNSPKFQATSAPGPREKEIVELFRKVQAQLRSRAVAKEDKKAEASRRQGKESEAVDSLLKLLRKHSAEQGKKKGSSPSSHGFSSDQSEGNTAYIEDQRGDFFYSKTKLQDNGEGHTEPSLARPISSFRRKSPVPKSKAPPVYSSEDTNNFTTSFSSTWTRKKDVAKSRAETKDESRSGAVALGNHDSETEPKLELESLYEDDKDNYNHVAFDAEAGVEPLDVDDAENDEETGEERVEREDLNALKLTELRALAKSRGVKGFSKMKKGELVELLGNNSI